MPQTLSLPAQLALRDALERLETARARLFLPALADLRCAEALESVTAAEALIRAQMPETRNAAR